MRDGGHFVDHGPHVESRTDNFTIVLVCVASTGLYQAAPAPAPYMPPSVAAIPVSDIQRTISPKAVLPTKYALDCKSGNHPPALVPSWHDTYAVGVSRAVSQPEVAEQAPQTVWARLRRYYAKKEKAEFEMQVAFQRELEELQKLQKQS